jgi:hypothetical protein
MKRSDLLNAISAEVDHAKNLYPKFNSLHEGYAVMLEEVEELWELIRKSKLLKADDCMRNEAIQIAAMAVRFVEDLYEG